MVWSRVSVGWIERAGPARRRGTPRQARTAMSSDFPAVFLKTAHLLARALDHVGRVFDALDALLAVGSCHDQEKFPRRAVAADLVTDLFPAPIKQPDHVIKLA